MRSCLYEVKTRDRAVRADAKTIEISYRVITYYTTMYLICNVHVLTYLGSENKLAL